MTHLLAEQKRTILDCVNRPSLNDLTQNLLRKSMLVYGVRSGIYVPLIQQAEGIQWYKDKIGPSDFQRLRLIPSQDWVALSLGTLRLSVAAQHLEQDRALITQFYAGHVKTVDSYMQTLLSFPLTIIAIATDLNGEFTVIDGVKHSVATYLAVFVRKTITIFPDIDIYVGLCNKKTQLHAP